MGHAVTVMNESDRKRELRKARRLLENPTDPAAINGGDSEDAPMPGRTGTRHGRTNNRCLE